MAPRLTTVLKEANIYVSNLPWTVGSKELKNYFTQFGKVSRANVVFNKDTGLNRGYGFVTFDNEESLQPVLKKNDHVIEGKLVIVKNKLNSD